MFTHRYKGMYINGYCDKPECTVVGYSMEGRTFKSYRAAQLAITKACKAHDAAMMQLVNKG